MKFITYTFAQHKALENYEYIWRLEPESFILGPINYDVFSFMNDNQLTYGYTGVKSEERQALVSEIWNITKKYLSKKSSELPELLKDRYTIEGEYTPSNYSYLTDFEISKLDFWKSEPVQEFLSLLLKKIQGESDFADGVVHLLAVANNLKKDQIHKFIDIDYWYHSFVTFV